MNSHRTTDGQPFDDEEIEAFLARESSLRASQRPTNIEVVTSIQRRRSRARPTRALAGVAAAFALVVLGVVSAALVMRPRTGSGPSPSPSSPERPLQLPAVGAGKPCPVSQPTGAGDGHASLIGDGSVRLALANAGGTVFFESTAGGDWKMIDVMWTTEPGFVGPVLVRGASLDGTDELRFGDATDPLNELSIGPPSGQMPTVDGRSLVATVPLRLKAAGCYGLQIDTVGRSSVVVFEAKPIDDAFAQIAGAHQLPPIASVGCPVTTTTKSVPFVGLALGNGPVYVAGGSSTSMGNSTPAGGYGFITEVWIADPRELGPILVRGGRIDKPGDLRFGDGSAPANELRLPIHSYEHTADQPPGWRIFNGYLRPPSAGCYAMQLDTLSGNERLVFEVTP